MLLLIHFFLEPLFVRGTRDRRSATTYVRTYVHTRLSNLARRRQRFVASSPPRLRSVSRFRRGDRRWKRDGEKKKRRRCATHRSFTVRRSRETSSRRSPSTISLPRTRFANLLREQTRLPRAATPGRERGRAAGRPVLNHTQSPVIAISLARSVSPW